MDYNQARCTYTFRSWLDKEKKAIQKFISSKDNMLAKLEVFENFRDEDLKKYFKNIKKTCKLIQKTVTKLVEG